MIGLYNAGMQLNEKGYYLTLLLFGLYSAISLQKVVRDKNDGIPTTNLYYGICWMALLSALALTGIGLYNAGSIIRSEKGFYAMTYILSLFAAITVQKNVRDLENVKDYIQIIENKPVVDNKSTTDNENKIDSITQKKEQL